MAMWPDSPTQALLRRDERRWERWVGVAAAVAMLAAFLAVHAAFNVAAHPGVDQNGYLVGGRVLAEHGTAGLTVVDRQTGVADPHQFVGRMWIGADIGTDHERYYPKYPPGLPVLVAVGWWLLPEGMAAAWAYWINPVCMTLGLGATFLVVRMLAGSALALLATAVVATSPAIMGLTTNPNSHAGALCFVTWGMYFALQWSRCGGYVRAVGAGLCLGAAVTFRYTEGLLVLPAAMAVVYGMRWRSLRSYLEAASMGGAWSLVVGAMVAYNLAAFGSYTGYDPTNESTGFRWEYFVDNWNTMLRSLDGPGLFMLFPVAVVGMVGLLFWRLRMGLIMLAWIVPSVLLYTAYYWAPSPEGLGYTRFFVTQFPAMGACAAAVAGVLLEGTSGLMSAGAKPQAVQEATGYRVAWVLGTSLVAALAILSNVFTALPQLEMDQLQRLTLQNQANMVLQQAPAGSVIISRDQRLLHHLQFVGDYRLYMSDQFETGTIGRMKEVDPDEPQGLQPQRQLALYERFKDFDQKALTVEQQKLINCAIEQGRRVFVAMPWRPLRGKEAEQFGLWRVLPKDQYETKLAVSWDRPAVGRFDDGGPQPQRPRHRWAGVRPNFRANADRGLLVEVTRKPAPEQVTPEAPKQAQQKDASPPKPGNNV